LFDTFVRFDLIKEKSEIICYRDSKVNAKAAAEWVWNRIQKPVAETKKSSFSAKNITCDTSQEEFEEQVRIAKKLAKEGELLKSSFRGILRVIFSVIALRFIKNIAKKIRRRTSSFSILEMNNW
jgi:anthranilate/para-aminobenzoate synthase component I